MAGWLDRWARRAAQPPAGAVPAISPPRLTSRRDFLKRAGIVGGVAWSVPVLHTVLAPAASASAGTPLGAACDDLMACAGGTAFCNGATCGGVGADCSGGALCANSGCATKGPQPGICGGKNVPCTTDDQCVSGNCHKNGKCK